MLRGLLFLLAFVAIFAAAIWWLGYSSCQPPMINNGEQAQQDSSDKYDCASPYASFESGLNQMWAFVHGSHDEILTVATIFIAIYTIILGTSTRALVKEARSTTRHQLRAYVGIDKIYIESMKVDDTKYEIPDPVAAGYVYRDLVRVRVKNFGSTPTTVLTVVVNWQDMTPLGSYLPSDFPYGDLGKDPDVIHRFMLDPGDTETVKIRMEKIGIWREARQKKFSLYVYGHIDYIDVFKFKWRRDFCYAYEPWASDGDRFVAYGQNNRERRTG
jgi:hypothetical protein